MRLRREVGDFEIVVAEGAASLPANLLPEQMLGQIIKNGDKMLVVMEVDVASTTYTLVTADAAKVYTYTIATGAIAVSNASNAG